MATKKIMTFVFCFLLLKKTYILHNRIESKSDAMIQLTNDVKLNVALVKSMR